MRHPRPTSTWGAARTNPASPNGTRQVERLPLRFGAGVRDPLEASKRACDEDWYRILNGPPGWGFQALVRRGAVLRRVVGWWCCIGLGR